MELDVVLNDLRNIAVLTKASLASGRILTRTGKACGVLAHVFNSEAHPKLISFWWSVFESENKISDSLAIIKEGGKFLNSPKIGEISGELREWLGAYKATASFKNCSLSMTSLLVFE